VTFKSCQGSLVVTPSWPRYLVNCEALIAVPHCQGRSARWRDGNGLPSISSSTAPQGRIASIDRVIERRHIQSIALTYPPACACHSQCQQRSPPFPGWPSASSSGHWPPAPLRSPPASLLEKPTRLPCGFNQDWRCEQGFEASTSGLGHVG
jgi:hypothetical protein